MLIPDYQSVMLPLIQMAADGQEYSLREAIEKLAQHFRLNDEERQEMLPSGRQATFDNRVGWARTYLKKAGLLQSTRRGYFQITPRGKSVFQKQPSSIDVKFLEQFPDFLEFKKSKRDQSEIENLGATVLEKTPEENLESIIQGLAQDLASELLDNIKSCSPSFFETLVVDVLVSMGYGGTRQDAGKTVGRSGDGGIDGIINEDRLGLDIIYIQAKRWENPVGRPEIQKFAGALQGFRARKGIFITSSSFTAEAKDFVSRIESKIILIDGQSLAQHMIEFGVGVNTRKVYELKKIDFDYFTE
ncbi:MULTISPECIES: restriction endonuclease [Cyanophyceae]|uniref:restriction endonuclease n=1 Tax=Cyanophyceae TaxID=3028117 RepID=UPI0016895EBF|nr:MULTISPECIES: restriction endonuclease [unclassified Phormidium]MBD1917659.1 restriction endonuclease [Phormidium sp. FACHB-77]MBD2031127.1 restriction endonuclease [Phormidium sp. FACHB-322]MBD2053556.1 restriction endonuclease [Leptolyngbya sp. FACHB-60]